MDHGHHDRRSHQEGRYPLTLAPSIVDAPPRPPAQAAPPLSRARYIGIPGSVAVRRALGFLLAIGVSLWTAQQSAAPPAWVAGVFLVAWVVAVTVTDKYRHKYPYRYYSYLLASHTKATAVMAALLGIASFALSGDGALVTALWRSLGWFAAIDFALSIPRRSNPLARPYDPSILKSRELAAQADAGGVDTVAQPLAHPSPAPSLSALAPRLGPALVAHIERSVPGFHPGLRTWLITDVNDLRQQVGPVDVVVMTIRLNDLRRINRFVIEYGRQLKMGGHLVCSYEPLEQRRAAIERRYKALAGPVFLLHFAWFRAFPKLPLLNKLYFALTRGRNRALSKAEVWGRLSFCGLKVVAEEGSEALRWVTAERIATPILNRRPSYYPVVGLTKVGLDGEVLQTHKVRSMYPFSEFLQKQIFEAHGLVGTGKFRNDFRLTEYGKFLRRHWIDELPQLYDWLRGDIKLVGMRATSPHFLSLYPPEFIQLYVLVKPGLIPPLFEEGTDGFDAIVAIEAAYLRAHLRAPLRTDLRLLWDTLTAILRGVRSK